MITILSFGGGQDSTAILFKLIYDQAFRQRHAPGELHVVMADTGNEHQSTVRHVRYIRDLCVKALIPFHHITAEMGFHGTAPDLETYWRRTNSIGSKAYPKTCTDRLKIRPIYKFLDTLWSQRLGGQHGRAPKSATKAFAKLHGKIRILIGIAKGEETRVADPGKIQEIWRRESYSYHYPLIDEGMDRGACQRAIRDLGHEVPPPSNCIMCPFLSEVELLWLKRNDPSSLELWIELEANKLRAHADKGDRNLGVWGKKTLPEKVLEVEQKFGHMSGAELDEYKFSHGHCTGTKY